MKDTSASKRSDVLNYQAIRPDFKEHKFPLDKLSKNPVFDDLVAENCENFFHYLNWLGLGKDPDLMVLSSMHHYFYDLNEL